MADYWKSQAKKFCEFCKCWIADNKPSVEFHEKGKRHKENVAKRLSEIGKKSRQEHQKSLKVDDEMKKMEEAALKAYMKDVEANADLTSQLIKEKLAQKESESESPAVNIKPEPSSRLEECVTVKSEPDSAVETKAEALKLWHEAKSDEGYNYYWHIETGEARWEPPEEGYMSLSEQKEAEKKELKKKKEEEKRKKGEEEKRKEEERAALEREKMKSRRVKEEKTEAPEAPMPIIGPAPRVDPYGAWKAVETSIPEPVDLQLPEQEYVQMKLPVAAESEVKFKEKKVSSLDRGEGEVGTSFKKRKFNSNPKRNMRQRLDED